MREYQQILGAASKLQHSQRASNVAVYGLIETGVEVNACCTVYYYRAVLYYFVVVEV